MKALRVVGAAAAVALALLISACAPSPRPEITDASLVGTWSHTFDDGSRASLVVSPGGQVELIDVPTALFLLEGDRLPSWDTDLSKHVSNTTQLSALRVPGMSANPYVFMVLDDSGGSAQLYAAYLMDPMQLYIWYGQTDNNNRLLFERGE